MMLCGAENALPAADRGRNKRFVPFIDCYKDILSSGTCLTTPTPNKSIQRPRTEIPAPAHLGASIEDKARFRLTRSLYQPQ